MGVRPLFKLLASHVLRLAITIFNHQVRVYDMERTVCDVIRSSKEMQTLWENYRSGFNYASDILWERVPGFRPQSSIHHNVSENHASHRVYSSPLSMTALDRDWPGRVTHSGQFAVYYAKEITVPVSPRRASMALSREVMIAFLLGFVRTNFMQACTFGSMEPGAKCPSSTYWAA